MTTPRMIHILLVDDDPQMTRLLETVLKERFPETVHIQGVTDSAAARQYLETKVVDVLITDLEMPGVNGLQLLRCAKRRNAWTQVVMVTGHTRLDALTDAMDLGASDYLLKPLDLDELKTVVGGVLDRLCRWRKALASTLNFVRA
jgi:DNA-binding NtrC family response regulator